jgi:hypothetical protein
VKLFRGGIESVVRIQVESGRALGLTRVQLARFIIFPQGFANSVPAVGANTLFLAERNVGIFSYCDYGFDQCDTGFDWYVLLDSRILTDVGYFLCGHFNAFVTHYQLYRKESSPWHLRVLISFLMVTTCPEFWVVCG